MLESVLLSAVQFSIFFSLLVCAPFSASTSIKSSLELKSIQGSFRVDLVASFSRLLVLRCRNRSTYGIFSRQENHMVNRSNMNLTG